MDAKQMAGATAAELVQDGMTVGLGTGSTVYWTIQRLGERVRSGLRIRGIPTSRQTEALAREAGIPLVTFADVGELDLTIDGADEVSPDLDLIKGGGGALVREKLVAAASHRFVVVVDASKQVDVLGRFPLPIEVVPFACEVTLCRLGHLGCSVALRMRGENPFVTDNSNYIADCAFGAITDPTGLHQSLKLIPGVVETGLFVGMADTILIGSPDGVKTLQRPS